MLLFILPSYLFLLSIIRLAISPFPSYLHFLITINYYIIIRSRYCSRVTVYSTFDSLDWLCIRLKSKFIVHLFSLCLVQGLYLRVSFSLFDNLFAFVPIFLDGSFHESFIFLGLELSLIILSFLPFLTSLINSLLIWCYHLNHSFLFQK